MPRNFSELKSGGEIPMLSPHPEKWGGGRVPPSPTDRRPWSQETICSLLSWKLNTGDACYEFQASDQLLKAAKSAIWNFVKAHPEQHDV